MSNARRGAKPRAAVSAAADPLSEPPLAADPAQLLRRWGADIDPELLVLGLTHRSFANEQGGLPHNERLEWLGDSVLSIIVTDWIFRHYGTKDESVMSRMRTAAVSQTPLAQVARTLGLGDYLLLGVGEDRSGGRDKDSILCDALEALIGATYLSAGLDRTRTCVLQALAPFLDDAEALSQTTDWKTRLQKYAGSANAGDVEYQVEGTGPDHARRFEAAALVGGSEVARGEGTSRRQAENRAARAALIALAGEGADPTLNRD